LKSITTRLSDPIHFFFIELDEFDQIDRICHPCTPLEQRHDPLFIFLIQNSKNIILLYYRYEIFTFYHCLICRWACVPYKMDSLLNKYFLYIRVIDQISNYLFKKFMFLTICQNSILFKI
jgi:hypothetical protein